MTTESSEGQSQYPIYPPGSDAESVLRRRMTIQSDIMRVMYQHGVDLHSAEVVLLELCRDGARSRPRLWSVLNQALTISLEGS